MKNEYFSLKEDQKKAFSFHGKKIIIIIIKIKKKFKKKKKKLLTLRFGYR